MKGHLEDGIVVPYTQLPTAFKSTTGMVISGYDTLSEEIHQADGFYDLITPEYNHYTQYISPIFFDEEKKIFTYTVEQREVPISRPVKSILTPLEFLNRFSDEEMIKILTLAKTDVQIELWWIKYNKAQNIDLNDFQTMVGIKVLEYKEIITAERVEQILIKHPENINL